MKKTDNAVLKGLYNYRFHQAAKFGFLEWAQVYLALGEDAVRAVTRGKTSVRLVAAGDCPRVKEPCLTGTVLHFLTRTIYWQIIGEVGI